MNEAGIEQPCAMMLPDEAQRNMSFVSIATAAAVVWGKLTFRLQQRMVASFEDEATMVLSALVGKVCDFPVMPPGSMQ